MMGQLNGIQRVGDELRLRLGLLCMISSMKET